MKFTQIPTNTFSKLQLNAGILMDDFTPSTGEFGSILGATRGGLTFSSNPTFVDLGADIDNCVENARETKKLTGYDPTMSGTFVTFTPELIKKLQGAGIIDSDNSAHIIPQSKLTSENFENIWWLGDYSDINEDSQASTEEGDGGKAGYLAIHLMNALNTAGIQITTSKNGTGEMAFEYHAHYSISSPDTVPFEFYCEAGTEAT